MTYIYNVLYLLRLYWSITILEHCMSSTCRISMILSLVSMTNMSCFSGSVWVLTASPLGALVEDGGRKPPPLSTTWDISSPTPWIDLITLLPGSIDTHAKHTNELHIHGIPVLILPACVPLPLLSSPLSSLLKAKMVLTWTQSRIARRILVSLNKSLKV